MARTLLGIAIVLAVTSLYEAFNDGSVLGMTLVFLLWIALVYLCVDEFRRGNENGNRTQ